jgi:hypothetical protein
MARAFAGIRNPAASNPTPSGIPQGTMGGIAASGRPGRPQIMVGDEMYLWILVLLEVGAQAILRKQFRRYHGG